MTWSWPGYVQGLYGATACSSSEARSSSGLAVRPDDGSPAGQELDDQAITYLPGKSYDPTCVFPVRRSPVDYRRIAAAVTGRADGWSDLSWSSLEDVLAVDNLM